MVQRGNGTQERNGSEQSLQGSKKNSRPVVRDTAVSGQGSAMMMAASFEAG